MKIVLILLLIGTVGCSKTRKFKVDVQAESVGNKSVEVNIVGVNEFEYPRWESMLMSEYWKPENKMRRDAKKYIMKFGQNLPPQQVLEKKNEIWKTWSKRKAKYLFVLADLPGFHEDQGGNADSRRLILPLDKDCWKITQRKLEINLESSGVNCFTMPDCD
jgi:hypothetical protein